MSTVAASPSTDRPDANDDSSFAATVAEELFDADEGDGVPGAAPADDRALHTLATIGHVGRYALKYCIGEGGLGTVYAALDPLLSRPIAVKTLHVDAESSSRQALDALEARLLAEARAAACLNHPNIVTVYDAGLSDAGVYIAMERLQGRDLRHLLADGWRPDPLQAARIARRVADALSYAHGKGVVHCDVKPANIFMVGRAEPKVLDFGIARMAQAQLDRTGVDAAASGPPPDAGSPYYMSPEQLRGDPLDARCDVYGLGVVLYELLTGQRAFGGRTLDEIRRAVFESGVPPAHTLNPAVSPALSEIVARAMALSPADRYRSARHFARALRSLIADEATVAAHAPRRQHGQFWSGAWAAFAVLGLTAAATFWFLAMQTPVGAGGRPSATATVAAPGATPVGTDPALASGAMDSAPVGPPPATGVVSATTAPAAAESARERRSVAREVAGRDVAPRAATAPAPVAAPAAQGVLQMAITPWGQVEINGAPAGTTPPLSRLNLPAGTHQVTVRNADFAPYTTTVTVSVDKPVTVRHRFGS